MIVCSSEFVVRRKTTNYPLPTTNCKMKLGFTLIEFLVVLGLLVLAVGSTLVFLTSILRGSNTATVTAEVKQNGQAILDSLERQIRNATAATISLTNPPGASYHLILTRPNQLSLHIACFSSTSTANGWIGVGNDPGTNVANYTTITNQDTVAGVDITNCILGVTQPTAGTASPAAVSVSFVVNQGVSAPSRQDFRADAKFQTTISLRKY